MSDWLQDRLDATQGLIDAYEAAILAVGTTGGVQSYTLDTGQTRQTVTRADLKELQDILDQLYNRYTTIQARMGVGGTVNMGGAW